MKTALDDKKTVTTETVRQAVERHANTRVNRFTTSDIARLMAVDEYQVRAAFTWLTRYRVIEIIPGVRSRRYLGEPRDHSRRRHTDSYFASMYRLRDAGDEVDYDRLMGVFCRG